MAAAFAATLGVGAGSGAGGVHRRAGGGGAGGDRPGVVRPARRSGAVPRGATGPRGAGPGACGGAAARYRDRVTLRWETLTTESVPAWAELVNLLAEVDGTGEHYAVQDLSEELAAPDADPAQDTVAVWDGEHLVASGVVRGGSGLAHGEGHVRAGARGRVGVWDGEERVAFGVVRVGSGLPHGEGHVRAGLGGGVHPDYRGRGIATAMFEQTEARALALAAARHPGAPVDLRVEAGLETDPVRAVLADRGYAPARYFTVMSRPLPGEPVPPPDPRTEPLTEDLYEATRLAHNDAFASHWGSAPTDADR